MSIQTNDLSPLLADVVATLRHKGSKTTKQLALATYALEADVAVAIAQGIELKLIAQESKLHVKATSPKTTLAETRAEVERGLRRQCENAVTRCSSARKELAAKLLEPEEGKAIWELDSATRWMDGLAELVYPAVIGHDVLNPAQGEPADVLVRVAYWRDRLAMELLGNQFRPCSTSPSANAREIARAESARRTYTDFDGHLKWLARAEQEEPLRAAREAAIAEACGRLFGIEGAV